MNKLFENGFFTGINYWGSKSAINMWSEFDPESIENDMRLLADAGITHLRVFPLWSVFQPLCTLYGPKNVYEYTFGEDPLPDTPAGRAGVSEEACQKFEIFCSLAEKYGMKLIVALITGHMSFRTYNPPAFNGKALLSDPTVIKWQIRFVKYFVSRFKNETSIVAWDLGNEPIHMPGVTDNPDAFYVWCSTIANAAKVCDSERPIISGLDNTNIEIGPSNLKMIGEMCDIHTTHPYNIGVTAASPLCSMLPIIDLPFKCKLGEDISGIPTFVQEFSSIGYMNCSRKTEADFYRASLFTLLAHGFYGAMWWCAFDQGHHTYAPYRWNTIGSEYGFFDRDLKAKPLVEENLRFKELLSKLPSHQLPRPKQDGVILIPREEEPDLPLIRATYMLAKQANLDMGFSYVLDPIPDSPLYIIPSINNNKSIPKNRLDELMKKVENGSVLYLCADRGLIREIPQLTGIEIEYRDKVSTQKTLRFEGSELPIFTRFFYKANAVDAEVLGVDERGEGVFFKHRYGKGYVCFMTLPLEYHLASKVSVFRMQNPPAYHKVYRSLAELAGIRKVCDSDHPFVRLTEHKIDESSYYIFAINYSSTPASARLTVADGYTLETVFGNEVIEGVLTLRENDGALFKAVKK